jgi:uncharacterized protein YbdZ (MbtH family)
MTDDTNPFEDSTADYLVLINAEGQYSLWPASLIAPDGWRAIKGPSPRDECLAFIDKAWVDMRPVSLIRAMNGEGDDETR